MSVASAAYNGPERRRHVRHALETTFWLLTDEGASILMRSTNMSAGGAYLRLRGPTPQELPAIGTGLHFAITAPESVVSEDSRRAEVVRTTLDGIAIRFLDD